ncbi:hypothetical protein ACHMW5_11295 [Azospirillum melinis]|uniref:hypothetical protein n=1 Tax=Azospirillum melinis TaxID=328839 RepID=UPI003757464C
MASDEDPWCGFLERALWGLRRAVLVVHTPEGRARHRGKRGYWRKEQRLGGVARVRIPSETAMSEAIVQEFNAIARIQGISGRAADEPDLRHLHLAVEQPRQLDFAIGDHSNPTDIAIELREEQIFDLRIEAKTVATEGQIKTGYINKGLKRFDDAEKPYTIERFGAMIAYVVTDDEATWEGRVSGGVTAYVGSTRIGTTHLSGRSFFTSTHRFVPTAKGPDEIEVRVVHFVFPVEADPALNGE